MLLAICDDEEITRDRYAKQVLTLYPDLELHTFASAEALLASALSFSIYLLDIEMDGMSGMELAQRIRGGAASSDIIEPVIIFITGYPDHMLDAFDVQAFHYLIKPVAQTRFAEVLARAVHAADKQRRQLADHILVKSGSLTRKLALDDIVYIESSNKKLVFHTTGGVISTYGLMNDMERQLARRFFRCHRGYLVNLAHVTTYDNASITTSLGDVVLLSRLKYGAFVEAFLRYAKTGGITRV